MSSLSTGAEEDMFIHEGETVSGEEKFSQDNSNANLPWPVIIRRSVYVMAGTSKCRFKIIVTNGLCACRSGCNHGSKLETKIETFLLPAVVTQKGWR